jgi:hypothetical protein
VSEEQTAVVIIATIAAVGFLAGLASNRYPKAPWLASAAMVLAYGGFLVFLGTWASRCWDCGYETPRWAIAFAVGLGTFPIMLLVMTSVWLGILASLVLRSFMDGTHRQ